MKQALTAKQLPTIAGAKIGILQSKWYREYTDNMVDKCVDLLVKQGLSATPDVHIIPGSLELPIAAKTLAKAQQPYECLACFGAILKGETYHFEMVLNECVRGLGTVSQTHDIPIIIEVLPCTAIEQLARRCSDDEFNKGIEAAIAICEIVSWRRQQVIAK